MLMRDFHEIRDVLRLFLVYGCFTKREIAARNGIKEITYDKYKRTLQNLIDERKMLYYTNDSREKCVYFRSDYNEDMDNPLFGVWQGKSFTANDIRFLFCLLAVLYGKPGLTTAEMAAELSSLTSAAAEEQTVRNRVKEYRALGLMEQQLAGKRKLYRLAESIGEGLGEQGCRELETACAFFQNVRPLGILGYHMRGKLARYTKADRPAFLFKHHHPSYTVDDEQLLLLLEAMGGRRAVTFELQLAQEETIRFKEISFVPLRLVTDVWQGRRYMAGYDREQERLWTFRLDKMYRTRLKEVCSDYDQLLDQLKVAMSRSWSVTMPKEGTGPERLTMLLSIDPVTEGYVLDRLAAEGRWGRTVSRGEHLYEYEIEVNDAEEMIPWIRTFTGRIVRLDCSNPRITERLEEDWLRTLELYGEGEPLDTVSRDL